MRTASLEEAEAIILNSISPLAAEDILVVEAAGRVLGEDIVADVMIPPVDDSAMDGYAVIAADTPGASRNNPVRLPIIGEIRAGGSPVTQRVVRGTAVRIMTGAPLPAGADAVIPLEDTEEEAGYVALLRETVPYANCRFAGGCLKKGDKVLHKGDRLNCADVR